MFKLKKLQIKIKSLVDHKLKKGTYKFEEVSCCVCGSKIKLRKKYNSHVLVFSLKTFIKDFLPYFDFVIPNFIPKLKKHSSKKRNIFFGYISICSNCGHGVMENPPKIDDLYRY